MASIKINGDVTIAGQPTDSELQSLSSQGFRSVVNFRADGEEPGQLSPQAEGEQVRAAGLAYLHVPVSMKNLRPEQVDEFRAEYAKLPKPVFAHCKSAKRAGAMVMMEMGANQGLSGDETLKMEDAQGFDCDKSELRTFIKSYMDGLKK